MEITSTFVILAACIAAVLEVFKTAFSEFFVRPLVKRIMPLVPLLIGGICGAFLFFPGLLGVLTGILAGALSSSAYEVVKKTLAGQ